jgi:carbon storage regulator
MLVLTRKVGEEVVIDGDIRVAVCGVRGDKVRIGIDAPPAIRVDRAEVHANRLTWELEECEPTILVH